jgi:hypothetical protein
MLYRRPTQQWPRKKKRRLMKPREVENSSPVGRLSTCLLPRSAHGRRSLPRALPDAYRRRAISSRPESAPASASPGPLPYREEKQRPPCSPSRFARPLDGWCGAERATRATPRARSRKRSSVGEKCATSTPASTSLPQSRSKRSRKLPGCVHFAKSS